MQIEHLVLTGDSKVDSVLLKWLEPLPEGTIEGLSDKNKRHVRPVEIRGVIVGLEIYNGHPGSTPVKVNVPQHHSEEDVDEERAYFRFLGRKYTVYFR